MSPFLSEFFPVPRPSHPRTHVSLVFCEALASLTFLSFHTSNIFFLLVPGVQNFECWKRLTRRQKPVLIFTSKDQPLLQNKRRLFPLRDLMLACVCVAGGCVCCLFLSPEKLHLLMFACLIVCLSFVFLSLELFLLLL